jgi:hypothetical protein
MPLSGTRSDAMSDWVDMTLDVLASDPAEIQEIELALQEPCEELIAWYGKLCSESHLDMVADIKKIVAFKRSEKLGYVHASMNKARRFDTYVEYEDSGLVWSHIRLVSKHFPKAIFLARYWNILEYGGKIVIRAGEEVRYSHFNDWFDSDDEVPQWGLAEHLCPVPRGI